MPERPDEHAAAPVTQKPPAKGRFTGWLAAAIPAALWIWANLHQTPDQPGSLQQLLDNLATAAQGPLTFVAFALVIAFQVFRIYFLDRLQTSGDVAGKLESRQQGRILHFLLTGLDLQQLEKNQRLPAIQARFRFIRYIVTLLTIAVVLLLFAALAAEAWTQQGKVREDLAVTKATLSDREQSLREIDAQRQELQAELDRHRLFIAHVDGHLSARQSSPTARRLARDLRELIADHLSRFERPSPGTFDDLRLRLAQAAAANAERRFDDALNLVKDEDVQIAREQTEDAISEEVNVNRARASAFYGKRLWENALVHYQRILQLRPADLSAAINAANCMACLGRLREAERAYQELIVVVTNLVEQDGRTGLEDDLALRLNNRGFTLEAQGKLDDAIKDYDKAVEIYVRLAEQEGRTDLANNLAGSLNNRGITLRSQGKLDDAIEDRDKAIEIYARLVEQEGRTELSNDLAMSLNNRGLVLDAQDDRNAAVKHYGQAIDIYVRLVDQEGRAELANDLAATLNNRGLTLSAQGKLDDAVKDYDRAIKIRLRLVEQEGRTELANDLAGTLNNRGLTLSAQGKLDDAIKDHDKAIDIYARLVDQEGRTELQDDLANPLVLRALALARQNKPKEATDDITRAVRILERLVSQGRTDLKEKLQVTRELLASLENSEPGE